MKAKLACRCLLFAGSFACLSGVVGPASAITLPAGYGYDASQTATANADGTSVASQTSATAGPVSASASSPAGTTGPGTGSSSGSIAITPSPMISGTTSVTFDSSSVPPGTGAGHFGSNASYSGNLIYYFEISGATPSVLVNANAVASYSMTALPSGAIGSGVTTLVVTQLDPLGDPVTPRIILDSTTFNVGSPASGGFTENGTYNLFTNTIYQVGLQVVFNVGIINTDPSSLGGSATFSASLDPTFQIAPGVANANGYSFVFSEGIGNDASTSTTPLPAALPLFATGLGGLGLMGGAGSGSKPPDLDLICGRETLERTLRSGVFCWLADTLTRSGFRI